MTAWGSLAALLLERFGPMDDLEAERFLGVWAAQPPPPPRVGP